MLLTQAIERNVQLFGRKIATIDGNRTRTWEEVRERIARAAAGLVAVGVKPGDRVGILALNGDRYFEALFAIWWCGAVCVPMNIRWSAKENIYCVDDSQMKLLLVDNFFSETAREVMAGSNTPVSLVYLGDEKMPAGFSDNYESMIQEAMPMRPAIFGDQDVCGIFYTGGTTGFPKGVMLSSLNLWSSGIVLIMAVNYNESTRYLHAAPMFHLADCANTVCISLVGGTHIFMPAFDPAGVLQQIETNKASDVVLVPAMIGMVMDAPAFETTDKSSLKQVIYGASPIALPLLERLIKALPDIRLTHVYGQTELAPVATIMGSEYHTLDPENTRLRSAGRAVPSVQLKIMDENGAECPIGEPGEIWVSGANAMMGYWNKPEATAETIVDGWVRTGDVAYMDDEGFIFICDRAKDMIVSGGENVFSAEVENAAASHAAVAGVAVIGVPDDKFGERVHAVIVLNPDATLTQEELYDHCHELIAGYKCPRSIEFIDELPLSAAGKVLKKDLRVPHWKGKSRAVN